MRLRSRQRPEPEPEPASEPGVGERSDSIPPPRARKRAWVRGLWTAAATLPLLTAVACATALPSLPPSWRDVPHAPRIRAVQLDADDKVTTALQPLRTSDVRVDNNRIVRGDHELTPAFKAIDSFDVSESRGEVAFSAKKDNGFDIGLVSTDGSPISWVPADPADEVAVQWAPRGNKISYVVHSKGGDFVRTVHIPTSAQVMADFSGARVEALGWDPKGEKFAVVYSTPDASDRIEVMKYDGGDRKLATQPAVTLDVEVESIAPEAIVLRPRDMQYNEKLPLVVWLDDEPYAWNDARAELVRTARVAIVIARRLTGQVRDAAKATPWIDASRAFVVGANAPNATSIVGDASVQAGNIRREGATVAVAPELVQSFAAHFIADQVKRTNGSSR